MPELRGFRFGPRDRRGLIAGVRSGQAIVVVAALLGALVAIYALHGGARAIAVLVVLLGSVVAFLPVGGLTLEQWLPVAARFSSAGARGARRATAGVARPSRHPPAVLAPLRLVELDLLAGPQIGALHDLRHGTLAAVIGAEGGAFALRDRAERARLVDSWSSVLAAAANGRAPFRLQWIVRSVPDDAAELRGRIARGFARPESAGRARAQSSYVELVAAESVGAMRHEILLVVAVKAPRSPANLDGASLALGRSLGSLERRMRDAGVTVDGLLSAAGLRATLRRTFDASPVWGDVAWPWPLALEESWGALRTDGTHHASYWIAEWPRQEVDSDFLLPLLRGGDRRSVSVVMAPVPPLRALREVERARTSAAADRELRRRHGFAVTARTEREQQAVVRREGELAEGHAAYRFSGYVTVSAPSAERLEEACGRVEQSAALSRIELRRLFGSQGEGFCCTLPTGRGCS